MRRPATRRAVRAARARARPPGPPVASAARCAAARTAGRRAPPPPAPAARAWARGDRSPASRPARARDRSPRRGRRASCSGPCAGAGSVVPAPACRGRRWPSSSCRPPSPEPALLSRRRIADLLRTLRGKNRRTPGNVEVRPKGREERPNDGGHDEHVQARRPDRDRGRARGELGPRPALGRHPPHPHRRGRRRAPGLGPRGEHARPARRRAALAAPALAAPCCRRWGR